MDKLLSNIMNFESILPYRKWILGALGTIFGISLGYLRATRRIPLLKDKELKDSGEKWIRLKDGRSLEYFEYGAENGKVLVYIHSGICTGKQGSFFHESAKVRNIRVISPSLPGCGFSDPFPKRLLNQYHKDLIELLDHLQVDEFALAGLSIGANHAAAVSAALSNRITSVALLAPAFSFFDARVQREFPPAKAFAFIAGTPVLRELISEFVTRPLILRKPAILVKDELPFIKNQADKDALLLDVQRSLKRSSVPLIDPLILNTTPWGFNWKDVSKPNRPIFVFSGLKDTMAGSVNPTMVHEAIPQSKLINFENDGHMSVMINNVDYIIDTLFNNL